MLYYVMLYHSIVYYIILASACLTLLERGLAHLTTFDSGMMLCYVTYIYIYIYIHMIMYIYIYIHTCTCVYTCVYVFVWLLFDSCLTLVRLCLITFDYCWLLLAMFGYVCLVSLYFIIAFILRHMLFVYLIIINLYNLFNLFISLYIHIYLIYSFNIL